MKLRQFLNETNVDRIVAIGPKNGNSYCYIGVAGDVDLIEKAYEDYHNNVADRQSRLEVELRSLMVTNPVKLTGDEAVDDVALYERGCTIGRVANGLSNCNAYLLNYKPIMEREVIDCYEKDVDDCLAIIVSGTENGAFWFKEEFDEKYKK